ncbi:energy-coupling factor transporter ATP-binding protein EcfA2 [Arthrobacter pascens]|uniref:ABC transporter ATP-binding protein n=1 Tax=Arthrobacter pascens TaxID=1677 RepID=UPI0027873785|nr:ABC transporter ATP-binding protein [Arthrobacter pascens]MDQ0634457.1 energy-coupling factor transporter ATP-binding protein EcfA2 [Arthrobacter pascens]
MTAATGTVLRAGIDEFTYHGGTAPVLRGVGLGIAPGSLSAVLGGSGSGKSTLGKLLAGWLRPGHSGMLRGDLELGGTHLEFRGSPADPRINPAEWSRRVEFVPQDAAAMLSTVRSTVAEELAFGLENRGMPRQDMFGAVARAAASVGLSGLLDRDPATLSGGELRRLAVGCAVITAPEVLVLDEPLASLDAAGAAQISDLIRSLVSGGSAVVVLGQVVDRLALEAGHWMILDGGTATAAGRPAQVMGSAELEASGVRFSDPAVSAVPARPAGTAPATRNGPAILELRGVGFRYPAASRPGPSPGDVLQDLDFSLRAGEIVAITGPNGAGKSTLLRLLIGLLRPSSGEVRVAGSSIAGAPVGRVAASVGLLFQHPRDQLFERTALREVRFGLRPRFGPEAATSRALAALDDVGLSVAASIHPADLPASQQRLLALATVLARDPAVLALDEPTVGLDRHGVERLGQVVGQAAVRGTGVVFVTHDAGYARGAAHRVLEFDAGRLREV